MDFTILDLSYEKTSEEYNSNVRLDALGSATAEIIFSWISTIGHCGQDAYEEEQAALTSRPSMQVISAQATNRDIVPTSTEVVSTVASTVSCAPTRLF